MCLDLPVTNTDLQASYGSTLHCITHVQNSASFELMQRRSVHRDDYQRAPSSVLGTVKSYFTPTRKYSTLDMNATIFQTF